MQRTSKRIILRADGNNRIGYGHVFRLLALADILRDEFEIVFATNSSDDFIKTTIQSFAHHLIELPPFEYKLPADKKPGEEIVFDLANQLNGTEVVVIDGYWFGEHYQKAVKSTGAKLVCIDDFAQGHFFADVVINHAPGLTTAQYNGEPGTQYYLGLEYALLRKHFFTPFADDRPEKSILISMGGSDHYNLTEKTLEGVLISNLFSSVHLLVPSEFSSGVIERASARAKTQVKITTYKNLSSALLVELMDSCSYAFVSASTVLIECYSRGIECFTGYFTANQLNIYTGFVSQNLSHGFGDLNRFEPQAMAEKLAILLQGPPAIKIAAPLQSDKNILSIFNRLC